jgi:hypothetical protein
MRHHAHQDRLTAPVPDRLILFLRDSICPLAPMGAGDPMPTDVIKGKHQPVVLRRSGIRQKDKDRLTVLTEADFEILERGTKQTVTYLQGHDEPPASAIMLPA